MWPFRNKTAK